MNPWTGGAGWTIRVEGAVDEVGALVDDGDGSYSRTAGMVTAEVYVDPVSTDVWDIRVKAKPAKTVTAVWIPWMISADMTPTDGAFYLPNLLGVRVDVAVAAAQSQSWAMSGTDWQGDEITNHIYPGDCSFPAIAYDSKVEAWIIGSVRYADKIRPLYSLGRMTLLTESMTVAQDRTWRVYIGNMTTPAGSTEAIQRQRVGKLAQLYAQKTPRLPGKQTDRWGTCPGFLDVQTQDQRYPEDWSRTLWNTYKSRIPAIIFWGGMSFIYPEFYWRITGVYNATEGTTLVTATKLPTAIGIPKSWGIFEQALQGTDLSVLNASTRVVEATYNIAVYVSPTQVKILGNHPFSAKAVETATGCCLAKIRLHPRNWWLRAFMKERRDTDRALAAIYARPMDDGADDPTEIEFWLRCNSSWCTALYADVIGSLTTTTTLDFDNLLIEKFSLAYPHACLVSGCLSGGSGTYSKQSTTDPGESIPNTGYAHIWKKTAFWFGKIVMDNTGDFTLRPVKAFLGEQNTDGTYPDWTFSNAFVTGCGIGSRNPGDANSTLITRILDQWDALDFWDSDWRFIDRIGLTNIPTGVDIRRFVNSTAGTLLLADQVSGTASSVTVTVDGSGTPTTIPMTGRLGRVVI